MTTFQIDSIVQEDGSIVIPSPSLMPGTTVHVVVTAEPGSMPVSVGDQTVGIDLAMQKADQRYADTFRKLAE